MCLRAKDVALACIRGSSALQDLERTELVYTNYNCYTWTRVRVNSCERHFQLRDLNRLCARLYREFTSEVSVL